MATLLGLLMIASAAMADPIVHFEEQFTGPTLDPSIWRTEILTSGPRWCDTVPGWVWEGSWVDEGSPCYGVAAHSPYGTTPISDGLLHISPSYGLASPYLVSRLPGPVQLFPALGDFTLKIGMRYDHVTGYGDGVFVEQQDSTEPSGVNPPSLRSNILLQIWTSTIQSSLGGSHEIVAPIVDPTGMHVYGLECAGNSYTISVDGLVVYGPVTSSLRPTAVWLGHPALAYWGWSDWTSFSVDYVRVEVPGPVLVVRETWGAIKARYSE
jgi:hypothetical protein